MSDSDDTLLTFDGVRVRYPTGTLALDDVTVRLRAGQFVSVIGPSGCGKSTLLRLAAGLLAPSAGMVTRSGAGVGYVFQDPTLLPWRSVRRNAELAGELTGLTRDERRARASEAIERVGLADVADQRPGTLSVGMRMRASLARALVLRPDLFLFDEPFAAVDEITRARLGEDLQRLFAADGFGALFVTHSVSEAVYLSGRVLVMSDRPGRIIDDIDVPVPFPRPPELRYTGELATLTARVHAALAGAGAKVSR
jgi:NitT/TauT family transport system ATP-binding protein